jgi:uncharacterized tellurite resistance protein B-like protein
MIKNLKDYFETLFIGNADGETSQENTVELATAVLLIEIGLADDHFHQEERDTVKNVLTEHYKLSNEKIEELIGLAENEVDHAVSLHEFTKLLNNSLSMASKINIIESLWHVAYADAVLDKYEEYYIRKIADLLYISHTDYIKSKLKAAS